MTQYSGTPLDGLLRIVVEQGGDRLTCKTGQEPVGSTGDRALRLTVPAMSNSMLRALCGEMAAAHQASGSANSHFVYDAKTLGQFDVFLTGDLGDDGVASLRVMRRPGQKQETSKAATPELGAQRVSKSVEPPVGIPTQRGPERPKPAPVAPASGAETTGVAPLQGEQHQAALGRADSSPGTLESVPGLLDWIGKAMELGASDLHLTQGQAPVLRVAGKLQTFPGLVTGLRGLLSDQQWGQVNSGRACDLAFSVAHDCRLRVNVFLAEQGLCAAIRLLKRQVPTLGSLGLPSEVHALVGATQGLVLVCGPTGAGKSTTLAALTESTLRNRSALCITLEAPIEYLLSADGSLLRQREVGTHVDSFATGLRDALREDPDVMLIGEMRDADTTALALTAAETGHLVLSSLHARGAVAAVERIVDLYPATQQRQVRGQLASSLRAIVSQRLLPTRAGTRILATEVMTNVTSVAHLIREGKTEQLPSVIASSKEAGMLPLERDLARLVSSGQVSRNVARAAATAPEFFDQLCKG
ncbi:MAG TPA: PilT/PilU family type 4a pilus ATPase [Polyangiaceae bacterium]|nr:PilT/PilU family type 4a pilus ATPase [Polyangiaceae bacterium]